MRTVTILLLEYEPVIAFDLKTELAKMGFTVYQACHLSEVDEICRKHLPDIALLNFQQGPLSDGMSLAKTLRARFLMKVLLITGARSSDIEAARDFYAGQEILYKPFSRLQLHQAMETLLVQPPPLSLP